VTLASTLVAPLAGLAGCGGLSPLPLRPEPIPYADTLPIDPPAERYFFQTVRLVKQSVGGEIGDAFSTRDWLGGRHEALNLTHFDDVVSSAWFEHRNGRYPMTLAEITAGPTTTGPDTSAPLTVVAGKAEGISPGFTVRDASGQTFLFKFDPKGNLQLASAAGVIANRLFYAAGYHTPEDFIVVFDSARLVLSPEAEIDAGSGERPMTEADLTRVLELTDPLPDGRFLALASKFVPGRPLGPFLFEGVREDDPNDHFHHEYRRELRGLYVVSSWLNHVDMRFENTLDVFIDPPGYVRHYLIDFAASLGSGTVRPHLPREGMEYNFDFFPTMGRLFTLGFYREGWEGERIQDTHPAVGWMPVESFEPGDWKPNWPNPAFSKRTDRDGYWGAKLVGSFSDAQIAAAVDAGKLPTEAAAVLSEMLIRRRDKVVAHWYDKVTPLERPEATGRAEARGTVLQVGFEDLGLRAGLWAVDSTTYRWTFVDPGIGVRQRGEAPAVVGARQSLRLRLDRDGGSLDRDELATLEISAVRGHVAKRPARLYLRWHNGMYEVVGLEH